MSIIEKFKARLAAILAEFGAASTDKGVLFWDGDDDLKAGDAVYIDKDGTREAAPDGDYKTEDGKTIKVAGGKVSQIDDPEAEIEAEGEDDSKARIDALEKELAEQRDLLDKILEALDAAKVEIKAMRQAPGGKSAHAAFTSGAQIGKTGDHRFDHLAALIGK